MCILKPLVTTYRVIWGFSRFVGTPRCRIFHWLAPGIPASGTRDQKWLAMCILETFETTYRVDSQIQTNLMVWTWRQQPKGIGRVHFGANYRVI